MKTTQPDLGTTPKERVSPWPQTQVLGESSVGVLLCHGFTGSPHSLTGVAADLAERGYRVRLPRLPGHGTSWQQMNQTGWQDWYARVEQELNVLAHECDQVFVLGLSMGGSLALRLAALHPHIVGGVILINPAVTSQDKRLLAVPVLARVLPSLEGLANDIRKPGVDEMGYSRTPLKALRSMTRLWRDVRSRLPQVRQPTLLFRSVTDHVVDPSSAQLIASRIGTDDFTEVLLHDSYHVATMDYDAELILERTAEFLAAHSTQA